MQIARVMQVPEQMVVLALPRVCRLPAGKSVVVPAGELCFFHTFFHNLSRSPKRYRRPLELLEGASASH